VSGEDAPGETAILMDVIAASKPHRWWDEAPTSTAAWYSSLPRRLPAPGSKVRRRSAQENGEVEGSGEDSQPAARPGRCLPI